MVSPSGSAQFHFVGGSFRKLKEEICVICVICGSFICNVWGYLGHRAGDFGSREIAPAKFQFANPAKMANEVVNVHDERS
jgi:hypothetical protein